MKKLRRHGTGNHLRTNFRAVIFASKWLFERLKKARIGESRHILPFSLVRTAFVSISCFSPGAFGDTLWLNGGEAVACSELRAATGEIHELVVYTTDTISGKNGVVCDGDSFDIGAVFAMRNGEQYFRRYRTGFVKRVSGC